MRRGADPSIGRGEDPVRGAVRRGGDPSRLRRLNSTDVLAALYAQGPRTLTEISDVTGLSRPTVEDVVEDFVRRRTVRELPPEPGGTGRPARRFRFHAGGGLVAGVDIGVHKIRAVLADLEGEVQHRTRVPVDPALGGPERLIAARDALERCLAGGDAPPHRLRAIGIGTPGVVRDGEVTLCKVLPGWAGLDLTGAFPAWPDVPVVVENDANLATVAEHWRGACQGVRDAVFVLAGHRISAGVLIGGRLHRGHRGGAGELGLLKAARWEDAPDRLRAAFPGGDPAGAFAAARTSDGRAMAAVDAFIEDLATGTAALLLAVDPECVVLGGGLSQAGDLIAGPLRERLAERCAYSPAVTLSTLADEAVATGAVRLALDRATADLFPDGLPI